MKYKKYYRNLSQAMPLDHNYPSYITMCTIYQATYTIESKH